MKPICISLFIASAMLAGSVQAAPAAKFSAVYGNNGPYLASMIAVTGQTVDATDFQQNEGFTFATIKVPQDKELLIGVSAEIGLTTDTSIKGINPEPIIGVIAAVKSPGIDKFLVGFIQGAMAINPDIEVKVAYAESFGDPAKGEQMANAMFDEGADIVYHVAGGTGIGVIEAAKNAGHYAIGVDTDQDGMAPGSVLTSMIKRVDVAVDEIIQGYAAGEFPGGEVMDFGLAQNGVALSDMEYTKDIIPAEYLEKVEAFKQDIIDGKIEVWDVSTQGYPDFFK